jgi:hypothetical protein
MCPGLTIDLTENYIKAIGIECFMLQAINIAVHYYEKYSLG